LGGFFVGEFFCDAGTFKDFDVGVAALNDFNELVD
jgi:hypothetical protein